MVSWRGSSTKRERSARVASLLDVIQVSHHPVFSTPYGIFDLGFQCVGLGRSHPNSLMTGRRMAFVKLLCGWRNTILCSLLLVSISALSPSLVNRRDAITGSLGLGALGINPALASQAEGPIAVLGASGRTGALCVTSCLERGIAVRALTRTGTWQAPLGEATADGSDLLLSVAPCDIKDPVALAESLVGCRAVIYAASASKQGGNAKAIDNDGVVAAGEACLQSKVPRYVVLSSTATTRPKSLGYIFTNVSVGGIMDEKRKGEQRLMGSYRGSSSASYTIIRHGGCEEPKQTKVLRPSTLEVSQGDTLAGIVSRADLAAFTVELAL